MKEIRKINKNYYRLMPDCVCSYLVDEKLMRKINVVLYKAKNDIEALLENNKGHFIEESWSLAYPDKKQTSFYGTNLMSPKDIRMPNFKTRKEENLFFIGEESIYDKKVEKEVEKILKELNN